MLLLKYRVPSTEYRVPSYASRERLLRREDTEVLPYDSSRHSALGTRHSVLVIRLVTTLPSTPTGAGGDRERWPVVDE